MSQVLHTRVEVKVIQKYFIPNFPLLLASFNTGREGSLKKRYQFNLGIKSNIKIKSLRSC